MQNIETILHWAMDERSRTWSYYAGSDGVGHLTRFLNGESEGICPSCRKQANRVSTLEGILGDHYLEHTYECACGNKFVERFVCIPTQLS